MSEGSCSLQFTETAEADGSSRIVVTPTKEAPIPPKNLTIMVPIPPRFLKMIMKHYSEARAQFKGKGNTAMKKALAGQHLAQLGIADIKKTIIAVSAYVSGTSRSASAPKYKSFLPLFHDVFPTTMFKDAGGLCLPPNYGAASRALDPQSRGLTVSSFRFLLFHLADYYEKKYIGKCKSALVDARAAPLFHHHSRHLLPHQS